MKPVIVAVVGNRLRGDDAAGPLVADALREAHAPLTVVEAATDPLALLHAWEPDDTVFIVDAVASGARPGTVHEYTEGRTESVPDSVGASTHGFGLAAALALARTLGRMPRRLTVLGIEGAGYAPGGPVHPAVLRAVEEVVERILRAVGATADPSPASVRGAAGAR